MKNFLKLSLVLWLFGSRLALAQDFIFAPNVSLQGAPYISAMEQGPDGSYYIGARLDRVNGEIVGALARIDDQGNADETFQPVVVDSHIIDILVQADGKVIVAGWFTQLNGVPGSVFRLNTDGTIDPSFTPFVVGANQDVSKLFMQTTGKIIVAGYFLRDGYNSIMRLNSDGSVDYSFNPVNANFVVSSLDVDAEENMYFVTFGLNKIDRNGNAMPGFPVSVNSGGYISDVQTFADLIFVLGDFDSLNNVARSNIAVVNADGSVHPMQINNISSSYDFEVLDDGRMLINDMNSVRLYDVDGTFLSTVVQGGIDRMLLDRNGKFLAAGGRRLTVGATLGKTLVRLNTDFSFDPNFVCDATFTTGIQRLAVDGQGRMLIGGDYSVLGINNTNKKIARILPDGTFDNTFSAAVDPYDVKGIVSLSNDKILVASPTGVSGLLTSGALDGTFTQPVFTDDVYLSGLKLKGNQIFVTGAFDVINGVTTPGIALLNANGTSDGSFLSRFDEGAYVMAIDYQADGKIIVVGNIHISGERFDCVRLNPDGSIDNTFFANSAEANGIWRVTVDNADRIYIGGQFYHYGGTERSGIARLQSNGQIDESFNPLLLSWGGENVTAIEAFDDGTVLIGQELMYRLNSTKLVNEVGEDVSGFTDELDEQTVVTASALVNGRVYMAGKFVLPDGSLSPIATYGITGTTAQTLTYSGKRAAHFGDDPFTFTVTASSGLPVTVSSATPEILSIVGGTANILQGGRAEIKATQIGNNTYHHTDTTFYIHIVKKSQIIAFPELAQKTTHDRSFAVRATTSSGLNVEFTSSNPAVAAVNGNTIIIRSAGIVQITATQPGNIEYDAAAPVTRTLVIQSVPD